MDTNLFVRNGSSKIVVRVCCPQNFAILGFHFPAAQVESAANLGIRDLPQHVVSNGQIFSKTIVHKLMERSQHL